MSALYILGLVAVGLILALLVILTKRKLYQRFPVFFGYSLWTVCATALRLALSSRPLGFFVTYWITEASYFVIALIAMAIIFRPLGKAVYQQHLWSKWMLPTSVALIPLAAAYVAIFKPITPALDARFASGMYLFVPLMCLFEFVLLVVAMVIGGRAKIEWTRYEMGILAGFGMLAFLTFVARLPGIFALFHAQVSPQFEGVFRYLPSGAFITSAIAWLVTFWRPEPASPSDYKPTDARKLEELTKEVREGGEILKNLWKRLGLDFVSAVARPADPLLR